MWTVVCEDFASSLAEKKSRLSREGHGRDRLSSNYRSFIVGKLPPPACPGLCYIAGIMLQCVGHGRAVPRGEQLIHLESDKIHNFMAVMILFRLSQVMI